MLFHLPLIGFFTIFLELQNIGSTILSQINFILLQIIGSKINSFNLLELQNIGSSKSSQLTLFW